MPDQSGRNVVITGANSGLGLCSALAVAAGGARVMMACRDPERGASALAQVRAVANGPEPELVQLDLADLESVRHAAEDLSDRLDRIDVLMNNAGVMALPLRRTAEGFESQFGTNHLGHFALTARLLPLLQATEAPRVVTTSSQAHRIGRIRWDDPNWRQTYRRWPAYGQSKLANLLFAFELDRRARAAGSALVSIAAHPGYASTHLQAAGPEMSGNRLMGMVTDLGNRTIAQSANMGALPQLFAATAAEVDGGDYLGPDGAFESRGHPTRVGASAAALDRAAWERMWSLSEELTGTRSDL